MANLNCSVHELVMRVEAAERRLGDLKAVHTRWYEGRSEFADDDARVISQMENIAYSTQLYLHGVRGPYLRRDG